MKLMTWMMMNRLKGEFYSPFFVFIIYEFKNRAIERVGEDYERYTLRPENISPNV